MKTKIKLKGFTLAEVLITLAVIGVVAVLSIGIFMPKIQDKVLAAQTKTAMIKFTKAMEQMALNNKIGPLYQDTEEFVSELGNYLKLAKVCDNDKLSDCFGYETFVDAEGKEFSLADAADGDAFNMPNDDDNDFTGDTKGIVTIDGTPMVLAWNKKCKILEPGVYQWGNNTNISTSCVAALMDVNGTKRPDKIGKDIAFINASKFGNSACIKFTVNGTTYRWGCPFDPTPLSFSECETLKAEGKIQYCASENCKIETGYYQYSSCWTDFDGDRWAGTVKQCGGTDKMASDAEIAALATYLYDRESEPLQTCVPNNSGGESCLVSSGLTLNLSKLSSLNDTLYDVYTNGKTYTFAGGAGGWGGGASNSGEIYIWSSNEARDGEEAHYFRFKATDWGRILALEGTRHRAAYALGICKAE